MTITAFLPCRAGSQRAPHKNTRPFADQAQGLLGIKLKHLIGCREIDRIVLSTNDELVIAIGEQFVPQSGGRLQILRRPEHLCTSATLTDELIAYVPEIVADGELLWTHVTSPFFEASDYTAAIAAYRAGLASGRYDSLMGVNELRTFIWNEEGPLNYDRGQEKWPRTQTLSPLYEVNSSIFIVDVDTIRATGDRIGAKPLLHVVPKAKTVDVDWEEDFIIAEELWRLRAADQKAVA